MEQTRFQRGWELLKQVDDAGGEAVINSLSGIAPDLAATSWSLLSVTFMPGMGCPCRSGSW